jgi:tRNA (cytosine38-C5)-methyltransferase
MSPQRFSSCGQRPDEGEIWRCIPNPVSSDRQVDPTPFGHETVLGVEEIRSYLDEETVVAEESVAHSIPDRVLVKWGRLFDIVLPSSQRTCCFTRGTIRVSSVMRQFINNFTGYTQLVERTGSIIQMNENLDVCSALSNFVGLDLSYRQTKTVFDEFLQAQLDGDTMALRILHPLQLRYFTPTELLRLFCFEPLDRATPEKSFRWPNDVTTKTKYRLIGNSVNVKVMSELVNFLFQ